MSLRERNAQRTREVIADTALSLFEEQGYESTTLEEVAERAGVSVSTLYRYFPTKDSLLADHPHLARGVLARYLDRRPVDEPLADAIGRSVLAFLADADAADEATERIRSQIDEVPAARARLWDYWNDERERLTDALRRRVVAEESDLRVRLAAHVVVMIVTLALDESRGRPDRTAADVGADVLAALADDDLRSLVPRVGVA